MQKVRTRVGFSLIEVMVAITLIGVLSTIVYGNFSGGSAKSRDAKRQTDLRTVQSAIEQYKQEYGRYPAEGCTDTNGDDFSSEADCSSYITSHSSSTSFMKFLTRLPQDPRRGTAEGYSYITNSNGTVYKFMVMNSVEAESVTYTHLLKSCDIRPASNGSFQYVGGNEIDIGGWCAYVYPDNNAVIRCQITGDGGSGRFGRSYGVWGGYEAQSTAGQQAQKVSATTAIICK